jgi:hypothetical protein
MQLVSYGSFSGWWIDSSLERPGAIQFRGWRINEGWKPIKAMQTSVLFQMFIFFYVFHATNDGEMVIMPVKSSAFLLIIVWILQGRLGIGLVFRSENDTLLWDGGYV